MTIGGYRLAWLQRAVRPQGVSCDAFGRCTAAFVAATWLVDNGLMVLGLDGVYRATDAGRLKMESHRP